MSFAPLPPWVGAVGGATSAVLANALLYPLDMVKTRIQVQEKQDDLQDQDSSESVSLAPKEDSNDTKPVYYTSTAHAISKIVEEGGISGLYVGCASSLLGVASTNFAYFYFYSNVRRIYLARFRNTPGTAAELSIGAVAGALAQIFTLPVNVITTRQQTQLKNERRDLLATARSIIKSEDGWCGLWCGLKASLVLVANPAITYGSYQRLRNIFFKDQMLSTSQTFVLGAASKMIATMLTQPLIVAKVGLQSRLSASSKGKPFNSFVEVMQFIVEKEGLLGLFKGIGPQILKGLLVQGILMMLKEKLDFALVIIYNFLLAKRRQTLRRAAQAAKKKTVVVVVR